MKLNKVDSMYVLTWSKKIRLINSLGGKCSCCGVDNIFVLEFHHPNNNKEKNIHCIKSYRFSIIEKEALKCVLLCRNCHAELHYDDGKGVYKRRRILKEEMLKYKQTFCCEKCGYSGKNCRSLEFHHRNPKQKAFEIFSEVYLHGVEERVMRELDKCEVVCRNCHGIQHTKVEKFNVFKDKILDKVSSYKEYLPIDRDVVLKLHKDGLKNIDIARKLNCAKSSITYLLK